MDNFIEKILFAIAFGIFQKFATICFKLLSDISLQKILSRKIFLIIYAFLEWSKTKTSQHYCQNYANQHESEKRQLTEISKLKKLKKTYFNKLKRTISQFPQYFIVIIY